MANLKLKSYAKRTIQCYLRAVRQLQNFCCKALQTVAAYIDLNPVRANLCQDPKDYRFCGYAEGCDYERSFRRKLLALTPSSRAQRNGLRTRYGFSSRGAVSSRIRATSLSQVDFLPG